MKFLALPGLHLYMPYILSFAQFGVYSQIKDNTVLGKVLYALGTSLGRSSSKFLQILSVLPYNIKYRTTQVLAFLPTETQRISRFGKYHDGIQ